MDNYSTISVPKRVKKILERNKGDSDWGEYLLQLYSEARRRRRLEAFERLRKTLSKEELERILEESKAFRKEFALR
ncbi:MAG: antitoxin VapB family protein [Candidatus Caldarchaeum sp.]|uniref:CopG family transcriptional regulator n=1 Tax=Caldiarchaeum subterraneum TaxID=311458 RepID=A0A7C5L7K5_CALS0